MGKKEKRVQQSLFVYVKTPCFKKKQKMQLIPLIRPKGLNANAIWVSVLNCFLSLLLCCCVRFLPLLLRRPRRSVRIWRCLCSAFGPLLFLLSLVFVLSDQRLHIATMQNGILRQRFDGR